jgi:hypothetical protein
MKVVTIKFENTKEWHFLFEWKEDVMSQPKKNNPSPSSDVVSKLFGSFPSDKSSDEIVKLIYDARVNQIRGINL